MREKVRNDIRHFTYVPLSTRISYMKKIITMLLILITISIPVFSDSVTKFGMNGTYNTFSERPEMGMYMTSLFVDNRGPNPVNLGFGMRIDMNASLPTDRMDVDFISGMVVDFKLRGNWGIELLFGPAFGVTTTFRSELDDGMFVGGGIDLGFTYYLDANRTSGINFGLSGSGGMNLPEKESLPASPEGKVTGYFGFTFRSSYHSMLYGSKDIYITL